MRKRMLAYSSLYIVIVMALITTPVMAGTDVWNWTGKDAVFRGNALGRCAVVSEGDAVLGLGSVGVTGVAYGLENWFYPGGYLSINMKAFGTLSATWIDSYGRHVLNVILYTVGEAGGWVNEDGHFAVWSNFRYAGICLTGLRTERVSGSAKGGPYAVPSMFFLTKLIPDGSPDQWLCLVWSQVNVQLPQGWVFDGAYDFVTIPKATTIPAAMTFNFHATPL